MTNYEDKDLEAGDAGGFSEPVPSRKVPRFFSASPEIQAIKETVEKYNEIIESGTTKDPKSGYYDAGGIETLDIIRAKLTPEQFEGYQLGCAIKYLCRYNYKGNKHRDAEKASNYAKWLSEEAK